MKYVLIFVLAGLVACKKEPVVVQVQNPSDAGLFLPPTWLQSKWEAPADSSKWFKISEKNIVTQIEDYSRNYKDYVINEKYDNPKKRYVLTIENPRNLADDLTEIYRVSNDTLYFTTQHEGGPKYNFTYIKK